MSDRDYARELQWAPDDVVTRSPTPAEAEAAGGKLAELPSEPPDPGRLDDELSPRIAGDVEAIPREHGELGAVLVDASHHFTGEDEV